MRLKRIETHIQHLFPKKELKAQGVKQKTQKGISSSTGRITEGLQGKKPSKRNIKKINNGRYQVSHQFLFLLPQKYYLSTSFATVLLFFNPPAFPFYRRLYRA